MEGTPCQRMILVTDEPVQYAESVAWEHDRYCESENLLGRDTPCWCEERATWVASAVSLFNPAQTDEPVINVGTERCPSCAADPGEPHDSTWCELIDGDGPSC